MRLVTSIGIAASLICAPPAHAKNEPPLSLLKTSKWEMRYDADSCELLAKFGEGSQQVFVRMIRYEPGSKFDLMLYGQMFRSTEPWQSMTIAFGHSSPFSRPAGAGTSGDARLRFVIAKSLRFDSTDAYPNTTVQVGAKQEAAVDSITFSLEQGKAIRLETESLAPPMAAMRACTDDLIKTWGYDPAIYAKLTKPPTPTTSPGSWVLEKDYPFGALMAGHSGIVQFRLEIDETGKIAGCHILQGFKSSDFDKLTCDLIGRRARFDPALDIAGKPVKWYYVNSVRFVMTAD